MWRLSERLREYADAYELPPRGKEVFGTVELLREAASALESGWIPVEERLPEEPAAGLVDMDDLEECIVMIEGADEPTCLYYAGDGEWYRDGDLYRVAAWMPLPEPYKREK